MARMTKDDREFLFTLLQTPSPTGFEMPGPEGNGGVTQVFHPGAPPGKDVSPDSTFFPEPIS